MPSTSYCSSRARRIRPATSAASAESCDAVERGRRTRRRRSARPCRPGARRLEAPRHLLQDRVAGRVAEAVVDGLEVVEVDEHDADRRAAADRAHDRVLDAVGEQRAVGEARDRVVEGLVGELVLERLALADVAAVQDDAADVLVLEQVRVLDLELEPGAVAVPERALDHVGLGAAADVGLADAGDDLREPRPVGRREQPGELAALDLVGAVAEHALDRRALVGDDAVGVEDGDEVARVGDERAEPRLALATVEVLRQRGALDGERDLRGERLERVDELARDRSRASRGRAGRASRRGPRAGRSSTSPPSIAELLAHILGQTREPQTCWVGAGGLAQPALGVLRDRPSAVVLRTRRRRPAPSAVEQDEPDARRSLRRGHGPPRSRPRSPARGRRRRRARRPRCAQRQLARSRHAPPGERGRPCARRRAGRGAAEATISTSLSESPNACQARIAGRDQAGAREQPEPERRQARPGLERRLLERAHRGVEGGRAPEQVVGDPADVVAQLVVVGVREQRVGVGGVHGEQARRCSRRGDRRPGRAFPCRPRGGSRRRGAGCRRADRRPRRPSRASSARRGGCSERRGRPTRAGRCRP